MEGVATWDFTTSFASSITAVGALLGTVLSAQVLPHDTELLTKAEYAGLNVLFGALVVLAPFIYTVARVSKINRANAQTVKLGWFLLTCLITLWAVLGELFTLTVMAEEIFLQGSMTRPGLYVVDIILFAALIGLVTYTWTRTTALIVSQSFLNAGESAPDQPERAKKFTIL